MLVGVVVMAITTNEGKCQSRNTPPPLSSRSSSFYRDGNGRTLLGSPVGGDDPAVSVFPSSSSSLNNHHRGWHNRH